MRPSLKPISCMLFAVGASLSSCDQRPQGVLSDNDAASLLADLHIAEAYGSIEVSSSANLTTDNAEADSTKKVLRQSIMAAHGVSEAEFDTTLGWYGHNLDKYEDMYELVIEKIADKQKTIQEVKAASESSLPSLWPYSSTQRLRGTKEQPFILPFDIAGDKVAKGGLIEWEGKTLNAREAADIFLAAEYTDGTVSFIQRTLMGAGKQNVVLQTDSTRKVKEAYGYLRVRQSQPLMLDSISLRVNPLNKTTYYEFHSAKTWKPLK